MVKLGNLLPGQTATIKATIVGQMEIVGGHYSYSIPMAFYPDYSRHGSDEDAFAYEFDYKVDICTNSPISNMSIPEGGAESMRSPDRTSIVVLGSTGTRSLDFFYRTMDMLVP